MSNNLNPTDINILIVGETGVGKSTFVNAFANYTKFESMEEAVASEDVISLIPSKFSMMDNNHVLRMVKYGEDKNESEVPGSSSTQNVRMYRIPYEDDRSVVLIDTPGIGDTSGIGRDETNMQNLLEKIAEFKHLHAILILLKPNDSRVSVLFQYCIKQLLSSLEKSAALNIVFLFTNSRGTFYKPGDTVIPLKAVLKEIREAPPYVEVPFQRSNTFCVDNESFRFLIAKKNNIGFSDDDTRDFAESWNRSAKECVKMLNYIKGLTPHAVQDTVSLNTARTLIIRLSRPMAEISQNIADNLKKLDRYMRMRDDKSFSIKELRKKLVVKRIGLKNKPIDMPMTVCAHHDCVKHYTNVDGSSAVKYAQLCHKVCYLGESVRKESLGDAGLLYCWAMVNGECHVCRHSYRNHMHIYYVSEPYEYFAKDETVSKDIESDQEAQADLDRTMTKINEDIKEYKREQGVIQDAMANFTHFLKHNAITPTSDAYKDYIQYFMNVEKKVGEDSDRKMIRHYEELIAEYEGMVNELEQRQEEVKANIVRRSIVSSEDVEQLKRNLSSLPLYGETINEALEVQSAPRRNEQISITLVPVREKKILKVDLL